MEEVSKQSLIEVIFEFHWFNKRVSLDLQYGFLIGSLYENLKDNFPNYEVLPTARIPLKALPHDLKIIQYRFRCKNYDWPVVQLGPGVLTVNLNENHDTWDKIKPVIEEVLTKFLKSYPKKEDLGIDKLVLKYLNAFDLKKDTKLLTVELNLNQTSKNLDIRLEYELMELEGLAGIRFFNFPLKGQENLIVESYVVSDEIVKEVELSYISNWLDNAHNIIDFVLSKLRRNLNGNYSEKRF
jgi:uncharacterized protein (TIGR04255 family)